VAGPISSRAIGRVTFVAILIVATGVGFYGRHHLTRLLLPFWVKTHHDVAYGPERDNRVDVMIPRWSSKANRPAVLIFHGGAWANGSKEDMVDRVCRRYLERGFTVANAEYRKGAVAIAAEDATLALRWFAAKAADYGADPKRILVTGESAGGHLALMAGFSQPERVAAVVNFYGITDLVALSAEPFVRAALPSIDTQSAAQSLSPITYVRAGMPPVLSIHGDADPLVPVDQTRNLTRAIRAAGGEAFVTYIVGGKHGFNQPQLEEAYTAVFRFLEQRRIF
jgi:acetyl esterase/lipase